MEAIASHYRIEAEIGRGRGGVVFRAVDTRNGRHVALKLIDAAAIPEVEASGLVRLEHPHIVRVHEVGRDGARAFVAQELIEPGTIAALPKPLADGDLVLLAEQLLTALAFLHGHRILHGDVKPENIFVASTAPLQVKLGDFGLARRAVDTARGVTRGSPAFMPPEVIRGDIDDERSDLYALGVTLYEAAFGELPFRAAALRDLLHQHLTETPARLRAPGQVDARFVALLRALLEKDPARRPPTATAALARWRGEQAGVPTWVPASLGVLVGREDELSRLLTRLHDAGGVVGIDGPSGIGKTRLLRELAVHAELSGHRVEWWTADDLVGAEGAYAGTAAPDTEAQARAARLRSDLGRRGFVVVVDDVEQQPQPLQRAAAFLLRDVASRPAPGQLVCVAGQAATAFVQTALTATGAAAATTLRLAGWETPSIEQAVVGLLGVQRLHASLVTLVAEATGGTPAGVEQACRQLVASQRLRLASTGELTLVPGTTASELSGDWVRDAMAQTTDAELQVLRTLALLRRPAPAALLAAVAPGAADVEALHARGLVRAVRGPAGSEFAPAHEGVRRYVLEHWDVQARRQLNDRIAAAFESGADGHGVPNIVQQALWHRACGSDPQRARAAVAALAQRSSTPLELLRRAHDAVLALHPADHPERPALELARIDATLRMGLHAEVVELSRTAAAAAPAGDVRQRLRNRCGEALLHQGEIESALDVLGTATDPTPANLEALALRARALTQVGRFTEALDLCAQVRQHLQERDPLRAAVEDAEVVALRELERFDAAQAQLEAAIAACPPGDIARRGVLYLRFGQLEQRHGQATRAGELFERAWRDFDTRGDLFGAARALAGLGVAQAETGQWTTARESFRSALELCRRLGESLSAANILANLGQLHAVLGQYAPALDQVAQGMALAERAQLVPALQRFGVVRAGILCALGLDAAAEPDLLAAETSGKERFRAQALLIRAGAALRRWEVAGVAAWLDEAKRVFEHHAIEDERLRVELARARLDALLGNTAAAAAATARVAADAAALRLLDLVVETEVLRAELLAVMGDPTAAPLAQRASDAAQRLGLQECIWRCERLLGHLATAAGDARGALAHYEACVRTLNDMLAGVEPEARASYLSQPAPHRALAELRRLAHR